MTVQSSSALGFILPMAASACMASAHPRTIRLCAGPSQVPPLEPSLPLAGGHTPSPRPWLFPHAQHTKFAGLHRGNLQEKMSQKTTQSPHHTMGSAASQPNAFSPQLAWRYWRFASKHDILTAPLGPVISVTAFSFASAHNEHNIKRAQIWDMVRLRSRRR
jgi:hypothetical protein